MLNFFVRDHTNAEKNNTQKEDTNIIKHIKKVYIQIYLQIFLAKQDILISQIL